MCNYYMKIAADNITSTNPTVMRAMDGLDPDPIRDLARRLADTGPDFIDVNPGYLSKKKLDRMAFLVEAVSSVTDETLILDSPQTEVLKAGLSASPKLPVLSALTMEPVTTSRIGRYKTQWSPAKVALFQIVSGAELRANGYPLERVPRLSGVLLGLRQLPSLLPAQIRKRRLEVVVPTSPRPD